MSSKIIDLRKAAKPPCDPGGPAIPRTLANLAQEPAVFVQPFPEGDAGEIFQEDIARWLVRSSRALCRQDLPIEAVMESRITRVLNSPMADEISIEEIEEYVGAGYANRRAMQSDFDECVANFVSLDKSDPVLIDRDEDPFLKSLDDWENLSCDPNEASTDIEEYLVLRYRIKPWRKLSYRESMPFFVGSEDLSEDLEFYLRAMTEECAALLEEIGGSPFDRGCRSDALRALVIKDQPAKKGARYVEGWFSLAELSSDSITETLLFATITGADPDPHRLRLKTRLPEGLMLNLPRRKLLYLRPTESNR